MAVMIARKAVAPVVAGAALALAGCATMPPPAPTPTIFTAPPPAPAPDGMITRSYLPPSPPIRDPPLRPVDPDPPALQSQQFVSPLTPPDDATDCTGWWRICHFY
jgi:hypothetical protein